ncbi:unnamed protein product [marine sediment metagenome]|uniref:DNA methylase N-4/N-6 domain-containing protein n=1 Tax=marine sediment metagenome TaxID=412755 RepID=X1AIY5_9ZZZZ
MNLVEENNIVIGDMLELIKDIADESINLVFVDPPYNIGKAEWDKIDNYLEWCEKWIAECSRVKHSHFTSGDARMSSYISRNPDSLLITITIQIK